MRVNSRHIDKTSSGSISMIAENEEDMWLLYNMFQVGDFLQCSTLRKVQNESATGSVQTKQVRTKLTIEIETIDFDSQGSVLHVKGRNKKENPYVKLGAYHTLSLNINESFTLSKHEWDTIALMLVDQASDVTQQADVAALVMHEGLCYLCLITNSNTYVRAKIEVNIPKKRAGFPTTQHEKSILKFFDQIIQAIERNIKFDIVKCIVLASPGFLRDKFFQYMLEQAVKLDKKIFNENKGKFVLVQSSSGHMGSLNEVLRNPIVAGKMVNTKATEQINVLDEFYQMLKNDESRAMYGKRHIEAAVESMAVDKLLISDELFRSKVLSERKSYVSLVDEVKNNNGSVFVFSSQHVSGQQLSLLSGLAAILRFPVVVPDSDDEESCDEVDESVVT